MVAICIYEGLAKVRIDRLYLFCLPFSYVGVFVLLHFETNLPVNSLCWIALLTGDVPASMLAAIIIGFLLVVRKFERK